MYFVYTVRNKFSISTVCALLYAFDKSIVLQLFCIP